MNYQLIFSFLLLIFLLSACQNAQNNLNTADEDIRLGGETSVEGVYAALFQQPAANLSADEENLHRHADRAFGDIFVTAPSTINGGLGTIFNQNSCEGCHLGNGRSNFPSSNTELGGLLLRISVNGGQPVPNFGTQLQTKSIFGGRAEADVSITERQHIIRYLDDSREITMTTPIFSIVNPYTALPANVEISPRIAPPVIGLGLLEAISEQDILAYADEFDANNDGISGRANYILNELSSQLVIGKFGWKASQPNLLQQTAHAYNQDMGITSWFLPTESSAGQSQWDSINTNSAEIDSFTLHSATFYTQSLSVPMRRNTEDFNVIRGKRLFIKLNCSGCHRANFQTSQHPEYNFLSNQNIYPYTDLLLHDMGEGLADNRPDGLANGQEWRTPPLWGIGLTRLVNGQTHFLHDGRAKSLEEAILWHGGEAQNVKDNFINLSEQERQSVISFLESL
jgi:CxxC motif-containing protein (DUF1111 family)